MSLIRDRHDCGECKYYGSIHVCEENEDDMPYSTIGCRIKGAPDNSKIGPNDEACSNFEPIGGWQE